MATDYERFIADAKVNGFPAREIAAKIAGHPDTATGALQQNYIAFKLFQIEEHMRHMAEDIAQAAVIGEGSEGIG